MVHLLRDTSYVLIYVGKYIQTFSRKYHHILHIICSPESSPINNSCLNYNNLNVAKVILSALLSKQEHFCK